MSKHAITTRKTTPTSACTRVTTTSRAPVPAAAPLAGSAEVRRAENWYDARRGLCARNADEIAALEREAKEEAAEPGEVSLVALLLRGLVTGGGPRDPLGAILEAIAYEVETLTSCEDIASIHNSLGLIHRRIEVASELRTREVRAREVGTRATSSAAGAS